MVVFALLLIVLLVGAIFVAIIQAEMPEVRIGRVSFPNYELQDAPSVKNSILSADVDILIEVNNKNEKIGLSYSALKVVVSTDKIGMGQTKLGAFTQNPKNSTAMRIHSSISSSTVDKFDGETLLKNLKSRDLEIDVVLTGTMGFISKGGVKMHGLPVTVLCQRIKLTEIDLGRDPKCSVKMFSFRAFFN